MSSTIERDSGPLKAPRATLRLRDGRQLGFAQWGDPIGRPILFMHGFGASRLARHPADDLTAELGVRLVTIDRPGIGLSDAQPRRRVAMWAADVAQLADHLGIADFGILGWSAGGPHALACAALLGDRITRVGLVSSAAPLSGAGAARYLTPRWRLTAWLARNASWTLGLALRGIARAFERDPVAAAPQSISQMTSEDRALMADPDVLAMVTAAAVEAFRQGTVGAADDIAALAAPWSFELADVRQHVLLWHGDCDRDIPVRVGRHLAASLPSCSATYVPDRGHFLFLAIWADMLRALRE
jgi:pimeloyl-ACP methyl ester carboxylesterase